MVVHGARRLGAGWTVAAGARAAVGRRAGRRGGRCAGGGRRGGSAAAAGAGAGRAGADEIVVADGVVGVVDVVGGIFAGSEERERRRRMR